MAKEAKARKHSDFAGAIRIAMLRTAAEAPISGVTRRREMAMAATIGPKAPKNPLSETLQNAISDMVELSSTVIEDQIRAGQTAAERLRDGIASSERLNSDVNVLVDGLVATTKDVGATWLEVLSIVMRSSATILASGMQTGGRAPRRTKTRTGSSGALRRQAALRPQIRTVQPVPVELQRPGYGIKA